MVCFSILRKNPKEAIVFLTENTFPTADEMQTFFKPTFSTVEDEKAKEILVMYNLGKCLKNIESKHRTEWSGLAELKSAHIS